MPSLGTCCVACAYAKWFVQIQSHGESTKLGRQASFPVQSSELCQHAFLISSVGLLFGWGSPSFLLSANPCLLRDRELGVAALFSLSSASVLTLVFPHICLLWILFLLFAGHCRCTLRTLIWDLSSRVTILLELRSEAVSWQHQRARFSNRSSVSTLEEPARQWRVPLSPTLWRQRQVDLYKFEASQAYIAGSGQSRIHWLYLEKLKYVTNKWAKVIVILRKARCIQYGHTGKRNKGSQGLSKHIFRVFAQDLCSSRGPGFWIESRALQGVCTQDG